MDGLKIIVRKKNNDFFEVTTREDNPDSYTEYLLEHAVEGWIALYGKKYGVTAKEFTIVLPWAEQDQLQKGAEK